MTNLRILHVIPSVADVHGGPSAAIATIERALAAAGVSITTATTDDEGAGRRRNITTGLIRRENGVERIYFRKDTEFYKYSHGLARWVSSEIQSFDILHAHALFSYASVSAAQSALRKGVPYIISPHGVLN